MIFIKSNVGILFFILFIGTTESAWTDIISPEPDPVAVVNGSAISLEAYLREINHIRMGIMKQLKPVNESQLVSIKKKVLEDMIDRELLYQESRKMGIVIGTNEVDRELASISDHYPDRAAFMDDLKERGFTEDTFKVQIEKTMARQKLIDMKIMPGIEVAEKEMTTFYEIHPEYFKRPERVGASHILLKADTTAEEIDQEKARKKMEMIRQKLMAGEDFATLAETYSDCPSRTNGGDLGYFGRGQMVKPFEDAAFELNSGEVSSIVKTEFGFHLIKVFDKQSERFYLYDEKKDLIADALYQQRLQEEIEQQIERLKVNADVKHYLR